MIKKLCPICKSKLLKEFGPPFGKTIRMVCIKCNTAGVVVDTRPATDKEHKKYLQNRGIFD